MTAAAAIEHQSHQSAPDNKREKVPSPRAIHPCLDIATSLLDVHTVTAQKIVKMSIAASAPSTTKWPRPSGGRFCGFDSGISCKSASSYSNPASSQCDAEIGVAGSSDCGQFRARPDGPVVTRMPWFILTDQFSTSRVSSPRRRNDRPTVVGIAYLRLRCCRRARTSHLWPE